MLTAEEIDLELDRLLKGLDGHTVIEIGVGLIGRGAFRVNEAEGAQAVVDEMAAVSSTMSSIHLDFLRAAARSGT